MTIYEIKECTKETEPYYFSKQTMKFFKQTMKSFKVYKQDDGRFKIVAPCPNGFKSVRYFNPINNKLEHN